MFLLAPVFIWMYHKNKKRAKRAILLLISTSYVLAIIIGYILEVKANPPVTGGISNPRGFAWYYIKPYIRLPPYFIGFLIGLLYYEYKNREGQMYRVGQ